MKRKLGIIFLAIAVMMVSALPVFAGSTQCPKNVKVKCSSASGKYYQSHKVSWSKVSKGGVQHYYVKIDNGKGYKVKPNKNTITIKTKLKKGTKHKVYVASYYPNGTFNGDYHSFTVPKK